MAATVAAGGPEAELELIDVRSRVRLLRDRLVQRAVQRLQLRTGQPSLEIRPEQKLAVEAGQVRWAAHMHARTDHACMHAWGPSGRRRRPLLSC
jgi:hypothetical protein